MGRSTRRPSPSPSGALAIRERALGPDHPEVAISLNNLGPRADLDGRITGGRPASAPARWPSGRRPALGPDHPFVASALVNLGHAKVALGKAARRGAPAPRARALAIHEKAEGPNHPEVSEPLLYLGDLAPRPRQARGRPPRCSSARLALHDAGTASEVELTLAEAAPGRSARTAPAPGRSRSRRAPATRASVTAPGQDQSRPAGSEAHPGLTDGDPAVVLACQAPARDIPLTCQAPAARARPGSPAGSRGEEALRAGRAGRRVGSRLRGTSVAEAGSHDLRRLCLPQQPRRRSRSALRNPGSGPGLPWTARPCGSSRCAPATPTRTARSSAATRTWRSWSPCRASAIAGRRWRGSGRGRGTTASSRSPSCTRRGASSVPRPLLGHGGIGTFWFWIGTEHRGRGFEIARAGPASGRSRGRAGSPGSSPSCAPSTGPRGACWSGAASATRAWRWCRAGAASWPTRTGAWSRDRISPRRWPRCSPPSTRRSEWRLPSASPDGSGAMNL